MDTLGAKMSSVKAADVQLFKNKCIEIKGGNVKSQNCKLREAKLGACGESILHVLNCGLYNSLLNWIFKC